MKSVRLFCLEKVEITDENTGVSEVAHQPIHQPKK